MKTCTRCELHQYRRRVVTGRGINADNGVDLVLIGEGPGTKEDLAGQAFVGPAGKLLDVMLNKACTLDNGMIRKPSIWLTNAVLCHPTSERFGKNREPYKTEVFACYPNVLKIVNTCNPHAVVFVGKVPQKYYKKEFPGAFHIVHPSFLLRTGGEGSPHFYPAVRQLHEIYKVVSHRKRR